MILSLKDITRITALGFKIKDFCYLDEQGFYRLRNVNGVCFFLKNRKCSIYEHRPIGCRFYPIIFDFENDQAILDLDCPLIKEVSQERVRQFEEKIREFVFLLFRERVERKQLD
ncbi:MAG: YkgJ family cysteine cluster protein [Candidatus Heimdallarchaeota archaeon]|nr:YkgJ family cysteine cluster protein [Candidatus Heimdallarchaeota archaeon]